MDDLAVAGTHALPDGRLRLRNDGFQPGLRQPSRDREADGARTHDDGIDLIHQWLRRGSVPSSSSTRERRFRFRGSKPSCSTSVCSSM